MKSVTDLVCHRSVFHSFHRFIHTDKVRSGSDTRFFPACPGSGAVCFEPVFSGFLEGSSDLRPESDRSLFRGSDCVGSRVPPPQGAPDRDPGSYPGPEPESGLTVPSRASSRIFSRSLPGPARLPGVDPGGLNIHVDRGFRGAYTFGAARASAAQLFVFVPAGSRWTAWLEKSGGTTHEADLSAQASAPEAQPRVLCTDVHPGWAWRAGSSPSEGSQAPLGLALVPDRLKTLKKPREFDRVFRQGRSVAGQHLVLYCLKRPRAGRRVAFCVSKKLGSAVVRNRIRRRLREVYRLNQEKLAARWDLIILARPAALGAAFQALETTFLSLAARAGLVREVASPACSVGERSS